MIEVTDAMIDAAMRYFNNPENAKQSDRDWIAGVIKISIELHEANKPKHEPIGYVYPSEYDEALRRESFCKMFVIPVTNMDTGEESSIPLYTTPPTRKPLSDTQLHRFADECTPNTETGSLNYKCFARLIEQAHGIGAIK